MGDKTSLTKVDPLDVETAELLAAEATEHASAPLDQLCQRVFNVSMSECSVFKVLYRAQISFRAVQSRWAMSGRTAKEGMLPAPNACAPSTRKQRMTRQTSSTIKVSVGVHLDRAIVTASADTGGRDAEGWRSAELRSVG